MLRLVTMTLDEWEEEFCPIPNHIRGGDSYLFQTYGDEVEFVKSKIDEHRVWTLSEGDDGNTYVGAGYHFVNRLGYYITETPYDTEANYDILDSLSEFDNCEHEATDLGDCLYCGMEMQVTDQ